MPTDDLAEIVMNVKKRFVVGESEFFSDLVFYHRTLRCMIAVELKKGAF